MKTTRHDYITERAYHQHGYRIESKPLPNWMHLTIETSGDSKQLTVHSRIHENKAVKIHPVYSSEFTDHEIIKDLSAKIYKRFIA